MALAMTIAGTSRIAVLVYDSLRIEQTADTQVSSCTFSIKDVAHNITISVKQDVVISDGATTLFSGEVTAADTTHYTLKSAAVMHTVQCHDWNMWLEETVVTSESYAAASYSDHDMIGDLFSTYLPAINSTTYVSTLVSAANMPALDFEAITLRQALSMICAVSNGYFYVDSAKNLHYFTSEANVAAFYLSDVPSGTNPKSYETITKKTDGSLLANRFYIVGNDVLDWEADTDSVSAYGAREAAIKDNSLDTAAAINSRGAALLAQYKDPRSTYTITTTNGSGLTAGMDLRVVNAGMNLDTTMTIRRLCIGLRVGRYVYELELGAMERSAVASGRAINDQIKLIQDLLNSTAGEVFDTDAPAAPTLTTANITSGVTIDADGHQVVYMDVTWSAVSDTDLSYYQVQVSTSSDITGYAITRDHPAGGIRIERFLGLLGATVYYARVRAVDWVGNASAWSTIRSHTTSADTTPPVQVTGLVAGGARTLIGLTWTRNTEADLAYYEVQWCATAGGTYATLGTAKLDYFIDRGFTEAQIQASLTRYYKVRAVDTSGNAGTYSAVVNASVSPIGSDTIATGAIIAGKVAADAITAACIDVSQLSAISADMGTLTAGTVTGATIRTAASGARVQLDSSNGIIVYNASAEEVFRVQVTGAGQIGKTGLNPLAWNAAGQVDKLTVNQIQVGPGGFNVLTNSAFIHNEDADDIPNDWTEDNTSANYAHAQYAADSKIGGMSHYITLTSTGATGTHASIYQAKTMAGVGLSIGDDFVLSGYIRTSGMVNVKAMIFVTWVNAAESVLQTDIAGTVTTNTAWTRYSITNTIPATAVKCYVYCMLERTATDGTGTCLFDAVQLERGDLVTQWRPGLMGNVTIDACRIQITDGTDKMFLGKAGTDLGMFGYDGAVLQVGWYAAGANAGKIVAGAGTTWIDAGGLTMTSYEGAAYGAVEAIKFIDGAETYHVIGSYHEAGYHRLDVRGLDKDGHDVYTNILAEKTTGHIAETYIGVPGEASITCINDASDVVYIQISQCPVYINDTSNASMTVGLTINQGANDDEILALKSSDVAHGMTGFAETDTYGMFQKVEGVAGGLSLRAFKDAGGYAGIAAEIRAYLAESVDTTKSAAGIGVIDLYAAIASGTGATSCNANGNLVTIRDYGSTRFIFDAEGSAHSEVEWTTYDEHDDLALLDKLQTASIATGFGAWAEDNRHELEALNIAHFDETPGHVMLNTTRLSMLLTGACKQLGQRISALETRLLEAGA